MSKRLDDDERNASAGIHIIEALRAKDPDDAVQHLAAAEKHYQYILNRGKDRGHPDYQTTTVTPPGGEQ